MFSRRHSAAQVLMSMAGLAMAESALYGEATGSASTAGERERQDDEDRRWRQLRQQARYDIEMAQKRGEAVAAPIRAERLSRKEYNFRKRLPKGHPDRIED